MCAGMYVFRIRFVSISSLLQWSIIMRGDQLKFPWIIPNFVFLLIVIELFSSLNELVLFVFFLFIFFCFNIVDLFSLLIFRLINNSLRKINIGWSFEWKNCFSNFTGINQCTYCFQKRKCLQLNINSFICHSYYACHFDFDLTNISLCSQNKEAAETFNANLKHMCEYCFSKLHTLKEVNTNTRTDIFLYIYKSQFDFSFFLFLSLFE
jgi:hypothetical protein